MKARTIITAGLLAFVFAALGFLVIRESRPGPEIDNARAGPTEVRRNPIHASPSPHEEAGHEGPDRVIAYYFLGTVRCPSCRRIEAYSNEAIHQGFAGALNDGRLEWRVVNVEERGNEHFLKDYQLYTKSLVLAKIRGGTQIEWKNLERVWELLGDKDAFIRYVQEEVRGYVEEQ